MGADARTEQAGGGRTVSAAGAERTRGQPWIPPSGLIAAHLAHGASWIMLFAIARSGEIGASMRALSWIHLVALGWLTLAALSVLLFVIPQFTDARWRGEWSARSGVAVFAAGAFAMVVAFWTGGTAWLWIAALVTTIGLSAYACAAIVTLIAAVGGRAVEAAIARAFVIVFAFLVAAALVGLRMAGAFATGDAPAFALASGHAHLAAVGWLTLLVMGVSARTIGPIAGHRSPRRWVHIAVGTLVFLGALALGLAPVAGGAVAWSGALLCAAGIAIYGFDMLALLATATVSHRLPQAFVTAAVVWLFATVALGIASLAGVARIEPAYVFCGLVGWIGMMVVAHLHHIGIRLIATTSRGDDDETPPEALLHPVLGWISFVLFQIAIAACIAGVSSDGAPLVALGGAAGFLGWLAMTSNVVRAQMRSASSTA